MLPLWGDCLEVIPESLSEQDKNTAELNEAQVVERVPLVAHHQAPEVAQPGEEPLHLPTALVAAQGAAILGLGLLTVAPVGCDHLDAQLSQRRIQRVGVVGAVADQASGEVRDEARVEGGRDEADLVRRSRGGTCGERKTSAVCHCPAMPMSFVPLPRLVVPTQPPPFAPR